MVFSAEPIQTVLVSCRGSAELMGKRVTKDNLIAIDWQMPISIGQRLFAIAVAKTRFSYELIMDSKCFVVNFMPYSQKDKVLFCGTHTGRSTDKFRQTGLAKEEAESVDCPKVKEACAQLECELIHSFDAGDHTIFVGKILKEVHKAESQRLFHTVDEQFIGV
jgi:flavin reductase (DIM6/NTAB) family NADH-FMN oxidoreductase RutF